MSRRRIDVAAIKRISETMIATMLMLVQLRHRNFEFFTWINFSFSFGGNFCLRNFELIWVIFTIFWSVSLREAYVDGLV